MIYYSTTVTAIGEEVSSLLEAGVLILYADGAPPALAEVSVQHRVETVHHEAPLVGARFVVGNLSTRVTAVGPSAWDKVKDMGHVVINFNGSSLAERPGEICVEARESVALGREVRAGGVILIAD